MHEPALPYRMWGQQAANATATIRSSGGVTCDCLGQDTELLKSCGVDRVTARYCFMWLHAELVTVAQNRHTLLECRMYMHLR